MKRNFIGYGKEKPKLFWPDGNKLAISIVVNIEEGAELSVSSGDNENEHIYENNKTKRKRDRKREDGQQEDKGRGRASEGKIAAMEERIRKGGSNQ